MPDFRPFSAVMARTAGVFALMVVAVQLGGCASAERPVLYPNDHYLVPGRKLDIYREVYSRWLGNPG